MGVRGPLPQPDNVRRLRGNPGKRAPTPKLKPATGIPTRPANLLAEAKAEWDRVVPELGRLGVLTFIDRASLVRYVTAHAESEAKRMALHKPRAGDKAWTEYRQATLLAADLAKDLYLSPGARARLRPPDAPSEDDLRA